MKASQSSEARKRAVDKVVERLEKKGFKVEQQSSCSAYNAIPATQLSISVAIVRKYT